MAEDHQKTFHDFAVERSHSDANESNATGRAAAQAAILINGGAATAILAYLSKSGIDPSVMHQAAYCLGGYGIGVFFGALMMLTRAHALDKWGIRWRAAAFPQNTKFISEKHALEIAMFWWKWPYWCFGVSIFAFLVTSVFAGYTLANAAPTPVLLQSNTAPG
jgi:hypothetical protein